MGGSQREQQGNCVGSVMLAFRNIHKIGEVVERPKALGDIRGVTYIYGMFYRFGLIEMPEKVKNKDFDKTK